MGLVGKWPEMLQFCQKKVTVEELMRVQQNQQAFVPDFEPAPNARPPPPQMQQAFSANDVTRSGVASTRG